MENITTIIKNINKLESEFNIFNSRILEFAKSTKKTDLDTGLLKKYIGNINDYLKLVEKYQQEILKIKGTSEYKAQKELIVFRLNTLKKVFNNTLKKLELILNNLGNNKKEKYNDIKVDFNSREEMLTINENLYNFYNNYNKNLDFQRKYNVEIKLNNDFESNIEKKLTSLDLTKKENEYIKNLNNIFETIEEIDLEFLNTYKETLEINKKFFSNFYNKYFPAKKQSFILQEFQINLKDKYENKDFNVKTSLIYKDFLKTKKRGITEINNLKLLLEVFKFIKTYKIFVKLNNKHNLIKNTQLLSDINKIYLNIYKDPTIAKKEIKLNNLKIKTYNKLLNESLNLIKNYEIIKTQYSNEFNFGFLGNLYSILNITNLSDDYIKLGLENIKINLNKDISNLDLDTKNYLNNFYKTIFKYNKNLKEIKSTIINLNKYILNSIIFRPKYGVKKHLTYINNNFKRIDNLLYFGKKLQISSNLKRYLYNIVKSKYKSSKAIYYAKLRAQTYNSYHRSSSYSSSSHSSSSWSSGSSGSFSSSYSSSGSSSW